MAIQTLEEFFIPPPKERLHGEDAVTQKLNSAALRAVVSLPEVNASGARVIPLPTDMMFEHIHEVRAELRANLEVIELKIAELEQRDFDLQVEARYMKEGAEDITLFAETSIHPGSILKGMLAAKTRLRGVAEMRRGDQLEMATLLLEKERALEELREADGALEVALNTDFHLLEQEFIDFYTTQQRAL